MTSNLPQVPPFNRWPPIYRCPPNYNKSLQSTKGASNLPQNSSKPPQMPPTYCKYLQSTTESQAKLYQKRFSIQPIQTFSNITTHLCPTLPKPVSITWCMSLKQVTKSFSCKTHCTTLQNFYSHNNTFQSTQLQAKSTQITFLTLSQFCGWCPNFTFSAMQTISA